MTSTESAAKEALIAPAQLLSDLKQHLANMERYAATCAAAGVFPEIEREGPQHESMAQVIRRLGSGQACAMSLRYLRSIIVALEGQHFAPATTGEGERPQAVMTMPYAIAAHARKLMEGKR